ncbi:hypothetical protein pb186bvf_002759 [Paramecium bursaria]
MFQLYKHSFLETLKLHFGQQCSTLLHTSDVNGIQKHLRQSNFLQAAKEACYQQQ